MADLKLAGVFLLATMMALNVSSNPIDSNEMTSCNGGFLALLKMNEVDIDSFLEWAKIRFPLPQANPGKYLLNFQTLDMKDFYGKKIGKNWKTNF